MPRRDQPSAIMEEFSSSVASFAACQSPEGLAKLIGFFHLADLREAEIDLVVERSGRVAISIVVAPAGETSQVPSLADWPDDG